MAAVSDSSPTLPDPMKGPTGNVYFKHPHTGRPRRETVHRVDSAGEPPPPRAPRGNPARAMMLLSLRRFAVFSIAMAAVLYLSIKALFMAWQAKDREIRKAPPVDPKPPATAPVAASAAAAPTAADTAKAPKTRTDLDTEAMRRAVFIAKRAKSLEQAGQFTEAIARYREALDIWPYLTDVWAQIGSLYLRTREFTKAQISLEKAVENSPGSAAILNDLGVAYLHLGMTDKSMKVLDAAIEIDPQFVASYFNMALCHLARNDRTSARRFFDQYLRVKPNDPRALREVAFLDASASRYADALRSLERAIVEAPDWSLLYLDAAAAAALMGRADEAIHYLEQAETVSTPQVVYRLYQEPAFKELRRSEIGSEFAKGLAERARQALAANPAAAARQDTLPGAAEPISSASPQL